MSERCAKCGRTEEGPVTLYRCVGCGRSACREHYLLDEQSCAVCAPHTFERVAATKGGGIAWRELGPRLWGLFGLVGCALAAYTIIEEGHARAWLIVVGAVAVGAFLKTLRPPK